MSPTATRSLASRAGGLLSQSSLPRAFASPAPLQRYLSALAILEQRDGVLNVGSLGAITAAKKLGGSVHGFVAGGNIKGVAEEAAGVEGIEKVIAVDNAAYEKVRAPAWLPEPLY